MKNRFLGVVRKARFCVWMRELLELLCALHAQLLDEVVEVVFGNDIRIIQSEQEE